MRSRENRSDENVPPIPFEDRCEECAGLCCVVPEIVATAEWVGEKAKNRVCEYLDMDASGIGHACSIYAERRRKGYDACVRYRCYGSGSAVSRAASRNGWILPDGTFRDEAVDLYDLCFRMAKFLSVVDELSSSTFFGLGRRKEKDRFATECEAVYRRFLQDGTLVGPDGNEASVEAVREWFFEGLRGNYSKFLGLVPIRFFKKRPT